MRIPFPERIPLNRVAIFAVALFLIQTFEGTHLYFSAGCVTFLMLAALAFNSAGGLTRASGAYVFFYSFLVVIVGLCYKAFLGEAADSNLHDPRTTIAVYVGGMAAMFGSVVVSRQLSRKSGLLENMLKDGEMYRSSIGCIVFGMGGGFLISLLGGGGARLSSAFNQLNQLVPLAIIIGVMYEIRRSGGKRSLNLPVLFAGVYFFSFFGLLKFSKQGILEPIFCWIVPVAALRFRLSALQIFSGLLGICFIFYYLVPYAQYGRRFLADDQSFQHSITVAADLLRHPDDTRQKYEEAQDQSAGYFNTPQGFWDRLQFISVDDSLNDITDQGKIFGLAPIKASFLNAVPRVFLPDKPILNFGNVYAHEVGGLPEDDNTTGISFSPTGEAYHMAKWLGVLVIAPLIWLLAFVICDSLFGDLRSTPWGLLVLATISHVAPEGMLTNAIYFMTFQVAAFVFCAAFATWVAPFFAIAVLGKPRGTVAPHVSFLPAQTPP